ncbi:MAG: BamA/TamA family outer membrane protein [Deltaproteobacteria bacterium]|nr:BamA/TamA family outer membrane protein [Deltaproteobacteria bacterium]
MAIVGYSVQGDLLDPEPVLRSVLDQEMVIGQPWENGRRKALKALCERLHYDVDWETKTSTFGVWVTLKLTRHVLVRHVQFRSRLLFNTQEIRSRMTLRPGSRLVLPTRTGRTSGESPLDMEERRLEEYLAREGYFDASVKIPAKHHDRYSVILEVDLRNVGRRYRIGKVTVTGNAFLDDKVIIDRIRKETVLGFFSLAKDFSVDGLREDLRAIEDMHATAGFPRARVRSDFDPSYSLDRATQTVRLNITVDEQRRVDVDFDGNSALNDSDLKAVLTLAEQRSYDDYAILSSEDAIRRRYQASGYYQADVTHERVRLTPDYERILFHVDEGPKLPVKRISFEGNHSIHAERLLAVIGTKVYPEKIASYIVSGGYLTSVQLEQDRQAIAAYYKAEGFPAVQVTATVSTDPRLADHLGALAAAVTAGYKRGGLFLRFRIEEGPRDVVGELRFTHAGVLPEATLRKVTGLRPGERFSEEALKADGAAILRLYSDSGYPHAKGDTRARRREDAGSRLGDDTPRVVYDVEHVVVENKPVSAGHVLVRGNFKTKPWVVHRVLDLQAGEPLSRKRLLAAQKALQETGLFTLARIDPLGMDKRQERMPVLVAVQEAHDNFGAFELGGGVSTDNPLDGDPLPFLNASYRARNIAGLGVGFLARGELGLDRSFGEGNLGFPYWLMPRFLPVKLDLSANILSEKHERFDRLSSKELRATLSRQVTERWNVATSYSYRQYNRREELVRPVGALERETDSPVRTVTGSVSASLAFDGRSDVTGKYNPLTPDRGFRATLSAMWASKNLFGTDDFVKVSSSFQWLKRLDRRLLLTHGIRYDHGIPLGGAQVLPDVERFFGGGDTTVRGIKKYHLLTEVIRDPILPGQEGIAPFKVVPAGGNIRFLNNIDLQLRILDTFPIASGIFLDTGLITNSFEGVTASKLRWSVGMALIRIVVPVGALSLEYAVPLNPQVGDDPRGKFHFNLGFVF